GLRIFHVWYHGTMVQRIGALAKRNYEARGSACWLLGAATLFQSNVERGADGIGSNSKSNSNPGSHAPRWI
ncbi:MAG TPA: hypothetical protein VEZ90_11980, partial [Blastocatellia bacterium]|nr:hypothetical protein [Blastocatellia bacterium]